MRIRIACAAATVLAVGASASVASAQTVRFRSPSGNIACALHRASGEGYVRCDIRDRTWSTRRPSGCPRHSDYGQGLYLRERGRRGRVVCAGDTTLGVGRRLAYGHRIRRFGITCTSTQRGMTCRNRRGHGFFLSRRGYRLF
jgi:hypothetical protein